MKLLVADGVPVKHCTCKEHEGEQLVPLTEFNPCGHTRDRLQSWCKECQRRDRRRWGKANRARLAEYERNRYHADLEKSRETQRESFQRWYWSDPDRAREQKRRWRADNPEKVRAIRQREREKRAEPERAGL